MDKFRSGALSVLVTSDLAARGLDIPKVTHVIHLDLPGDTDAFIHRVGRTARNGASGTSVVIGDAYEMGRYAALEKKLGIIVYPKELWGGHLVAPVGDGQNPSSSE
jgi:superfamily II DNA/RNA helicase